MKPWIKKLLSESECLLEIEDVIHFVSDFENEVYVTRRVDYGNEYSEEYLEANEIMSIDDMVELKVTARAMGMVVSRGEALKNDDCYMPSLLPRLEKGNADYKCTHIVRHPYTEERYKKLGRTAAEIFGRELQLREWHMLSLLSSEWALSDAMMISLLKVLREQETKKVQKDRGAIR